MTSLPCKPLLTSWNPLTQLVRFRTRTPDIRKPIPQHRLRAVALKLTKPVYDKTLNPLLPIKPVKPKIIKAQENSFERILANEFYQILESSKVVAMVHRNPMGQKEIYKMKLLFHKSKMKYLWYSNTVAKLAMSGTYYEPLLPLYQSHTVTVVIEENSVAKVRSYRTAQHN
ncbi:large ribosomal subunit protein uL10m-like [Oratosquilla oratoria]|uniref:large ribosomal subunit protein uL10m-like n=1 Tax=Oratosquilla oratoria TaxID=337810 RepID=UPI003F7614EC